MKPRIASMIASATEIVCALGCEDQLVARSHECDWPPSVKRLPVCTAPRFDVHGSSRQIDERVKSLLGDASPIYHVDAEMLQALQADVIITQAHCEVCAVSEKDVVSALANSPPSPHRGRGAGGEGANDLPSPHRGRGAGGEGASPKVVSLSPNNLADVWQSIRNVADALDVPDRGERLVQQLQSRVTAIATAAKSLKQPAVACLEWLDPLMAAGNWVPELAQRAGGRNLFGVPGQHSPWMNWDQLIAADPMFVIALPCGFDLAKTRSEMATLAAHPDWTRLQAVRAGRVFVTDGNQYFNRPGPRLVESLEILAEIFHPETFQFGHEGTGWQQFT